MVCYLLQLLLQHSTTRGEKRRHDYTEEENTGKFFFLYVYVFGGLECVGHSFAYDAYLVFLEMSGFEPRELL